MWCYVLVGKCVFSFHNLHELKCCEHKTKVWMTSVKGVYAANTCPQQHMLLSSCDVTGPLNRFTPLGVGTVSQWPGPGGTKAIMFCTQLRFPLSCLPQQSCMSACLAPLWLQSLSESGLHCHNRCALKAGWRLICVSCSYSPDQSKLYIAQRWREEAEQTLTQPIKNILNWWPQIISLLHIKLSKVFQTLPFCSGPLPWEGMRSWYSGINSSVRTMD